MIPRSRGLARLPALLQQHHRAGGSGTWRQLDGLRGFAPAQTERTLRKIIQTVKAADA